MGLARPRSGAARKRSIFLAPCGGRGQDGSQQHMWRLVQKKGDAFFRLAGSPKAHATAEAVLANREGAYCNLVLPATLDTTEGTQLDLDSGADSASDNLHEKLRIMSRYSSGRRHFLKSRLRCNDATFGCNAAHKTA